MPVLTSDALQRMLCHNPLHKDNVLLEWVMALECFHSPQSRVSRVLPILFGQRVTSRSDAIGDLYAVGTLDLLPDTIPQETLQCAIRLLRSNGVEPRPEISTYTVRGILDQLKVLLGYCAWTAVEPAAVVVESAGRVIISLQEVLDEAKGAKVVEPATDTANGGQVLTPVPLTSTSRLNAGAADAVTGSLPQKRPVKVMVDAIRVQLCLGADLPLAQVLEDALGMLGDAALVEECKALGLLAKAERIFAAIMG